MTDGGRRGGTRSGISWVAWVATLVALLGCEHELGEASGVSVTGHVLLEDEIAERPARALLMVELVVEVREGELPEAFASAVLEVPEDYPEEGVPFELRYVRPGSYWLRARIRDAAKLGAPLADSRVKACPFEFYADSFEVADRDLSQRVVTLRDPEAIPEACVTEALDGGAGEDGGVPVEEPADDPFEGFGVPCVAGEDRAARQNRSDDCGENAPICAALPDQEVGFCTQIDCLPEDSSSCPPGWLCFDISAFYSQGAYMCIDPSLF